MSKSDLPDFSKGIQGLLPAIAQDRQSGKILMLAWMNEEAWHETLSTKRAVYYSRSRKKLWRKGEESGHVQELHEARVDCDGDAILLIVSQTGAACHEGYESCFFRRIDSGGEIKIVEPRLRTPAEIYGLSTKS